MLQRNAATPSLGSLAVAAPGSPASRQVGALSGSLFNAQWRVLVHGLVASSLSKLQEGFQNYPAPILVVAEQGPRLGAPFLQLGYQPQVRASLGAGDLQVLWHVWHVMLSNIHGIR